MNWDDVRIFLAVARKGQILAAAKALGLNHATVARRITALEHDLGSSLLRRRPNGSELTTQGERFLSHAETMESASLAAREAAGADSAIEGTVRVGAPDGFGVGFLAPRLGELADRHPDLLVELVPVPRSFSLSRREADIAITLERPREGRLVARKLTDYQLGLYAAPCYLERHGVPVVAADLATHRLVGYVEDLIYTPSLDYTAAFSKDWRTSLAISSAIGQAQAIRAGAGIGILHTFMAHSDPNLKSVLPELTLGRAYWTVMHEDIRNLRRMAVVSEFLSEIAARDRAVLAGKSSG